MYRFDEPGTFEVQLTVRDRAINSVSSNIKFQSEWTPIEVLPAQPGKRTQWLDGVRARHPMDAGELISDMLPSVLGLPDEESLAIVRSYLDHPEGNVQRYAENGLYYWPEAARPHHQ